MKNVSCVTALTGIRYLVPTNSKRYRVIRRKSNSAASSLLCCTSTTYVRTELSSLKYLYTLVNEYEYQVQYYIVLVYTPEYIRIFKKKIQSAHLASVQFLHDFVYHSREAYRLRYNLECAGYKSEGQQESAV